MYISFVQKSILAFKRQLKKSFILNDIQQQCTALYLRGGALTRRPRSGPAVGTVSGAGAGLWAGGGLRPRVEQRISAGVFCTAGGRGRPRSVSMILVLLDCVVACSAAARERQVRQLEGYKVW